MTDFVRLDDHKEKFQDMDSCHEFVDLFEKNKKIILTKFLDEIDLINNLEAY